MTVFTDKEKAESEKSIGNARIKVATRGHGTFPFDKISNKDRLAMTRQGVKEVLSGTRKSNRIKQGLPAIQRPPSRTKLAAAKKRKK